MNKIRKKKKVLLLGPTPPPIGGISRYCEDIMMDSHLKVDWDITFFDITIPRHFRPITYINRKSPNIFSRDGILNTFRQIFWVWNRTREFENLMASGQYDIAHITSCTGWGFWRNALHTYYAKRHKIKVFWHILGAIDDFWRNGTKWRQYFIRRFLNMADIHVVQSNGLREITSQYTHKPVIAIYNGVPIDQWAPPDGYAHSNPGKKKVRIITLGVLSHRKGYYDLINVAKRICPDFPQLEFVFVGSGEIEKFRKLLRDEKVDDWITAAGMVNDEELIRLLQTADIFAFPTYAEGQPIALLEAMAAGLPVITTPVGSIAEFIKKQNGLLMKPGDLNALEKHIITLVKSPELRESMGRQNVRDAEEKFSKQRTMKEIGQTYESLLIEKK